MTSTLAQLHGTADHACSKKNDKKKTTTTKTKLKKYLHAGERLSKTRGFYWFLFCLCCQMWSPNPSVFSLLKSHLDALTPLLASEYPPIYYSLLHALFQDCRR